MKGMQTPSLIWQITKNLIAGTLLFSTLLTAAYAEKLKIRLDADAVETLSEEAETINPQVLDLALKAFKNVSAEGYVRKPYLVVIDYSVPSYEKRMWIFDLEEQEVLYKLHVTHGVNTGNIDATEFSNKVGSLQSSLGVFVTQNPYMGRNGYSLRLQGLEPGINHNAKKRGIVIHGAHYASADFVKKNGRLGRSWGCPAIDAKVNADVIKLIKHGSVVFSYYPDKTWLASSEYAEANVSKDA